MTCDKQFHKIHMKCRAIVKVILMKKEKILLLYKAYAKSTLSVKIAQLQK